MIEVIKDKQVVETHSVNIDADFMFRVNADDPLTQGVIDGDKPNPCKVINVRDGDILFFKEGLTPKQDDVVYARIEECGYTYLKVRHYDPHGEHIALRSTFEGCEDEVWWTDNVEILGVCVAVQYNNRWNQLVLPDSENGMIAPFDKQSEGINESDKVLA